MRVKLRDHLQALVPLLLENTKRAFQIELFKIKPTEGTAHLLLLI